MKVIYKFKIGTKINAAIVKWISVGYDYKNQACAWAIVDYDVKDEKKKEYYLGILATGEPFIDDFEIIGTIDNGPYIWHVYVKEI